MNKQILLSLALSTLLVIVVALVPMKIGASVTNEYCPVTTNELAEEKFSLEYKGETIYFCCNSCIKDFIANPDRYIANLSTSVDSSQNDNHDNDHSHSTEEDTNKVIVSKSGNDAHDHTTDHVQSNTLLTLIGKLHPLAVHFPIALIFTSLFFTSISMFFKVELFNTMSVYIVYLAAVSAVISAVLGLIAGSSSEYPSFLVSTLDWHRILGISSSALMLITAFFGYKSLHTNPNGGARLYRLVLLLNTILIGVTGHFGATLVYGLNYFNF